MRKGRSVAGAARSAVLRGLRQPVVGVLVLAGIADIVSGDPFVHGGALVAVGVAIAVDARRPKNAGRGDETTAASVVVVPDVPLIRVTAARLLGASAFALGVGTFARYSWPATFAIAIPATAGVIVAWRTPAGWRDPGALERRAVWAWSMVFLALALYELMNELLQPSLIQGSADHPTVSVLMDPVLASHAGRTAFLAVWLAAGWYFIER